MDIWFSNYINAVMELNRLLGMRFIWDGKEYKSIGLRTPIGESVLMVGVYHNKHDYSNRNVEIVKLSMLVKHLQTIDKYDQKLLKKFKGALHDTNKNWETYFGVRMEINIAASLIGKGVNFNKTESPDFTIPDCGVFIECSSTHKIESSSAHLIDKIRLSIMEKSRQPYCNSSTVLCLDITNISATFGDSENELLASKDGMQRIVKQILSDTNSNYGSVLLFSYFMDMKDCFHSGYWRTDNDGISHGLTTFLDKYFPIGEFSTGPGWTPKTG